MQMNADDAHVPRPAFSELLESARLPVLRTSSARDLRDLVRVLESACEKARIAAIRNVRSSRRNAQGSSDANSNCGFADLFDALRGAKAEVRRRDRERTPRTSAPSGNGKRQPRRNALNRPGT